jgi:hypothetical protein
MLQLAMGTDIMLFKDLTLKVTDMGPPVTLTDNERVYRYQQITQTHSCTTPRSLQVGDVVVLDKEPVPNKDILVRRVLNPCGEACKYFLYDFIG